MMVNGLHTLALVLKLNLVAAIKGLIAAIHTIAAITLATLLAIPLAILLAILLAITLAVIAAILALLAATTQLQLKHAIRSKLVAQTLH
jgi:hypothetical protein